MVSATFSEAAVAAPVVAATELALTLVIARREEQASGIVVLDLVDPDGGALPPFEPGAHVDVEVAPGLVRQYSLCGDPADASTYRLGILLDPASRGGSGALPPALRAGAALRIGSPRNLFPLAPGARRSILIGGGIGITPMVAMAYHLHRISNDFTLHYCVRTPAIAAFAGELQEAPFRDRVHLHVDDGAEAQRFDPARDLPPPADGVHLYVCGPDGFMAFVIAAAERLGYGAARIHREYFKADVDRSGEAFEIVLARSNRRIAVDAGSTIVAALAKAGVNIETSCEEGICGTCLCNVVSGTPDHRDVYLTDEEKAANDQMLLCCSRSKTPELVLDL
ncbi:PDR/VanB family oxidoreductase [Bradyrhizobium cosmicum]|uniref:PDR/VanB family oxidoreductase n=1 Tax=Bradyrhizobium cosmicum TaxID=1404864 RepID=UPI0028ECC1AD|nr:PDR/VanB family oxidoreductase [Bradyrhizobium cosmicum]